MTRLFALIAGGFLALGVAGVAEIIHHGGYSPFLAMPSAPAVAASPSSQQAVSPLRASIRVAGEN